MNMVKMNMVNTYYDLPDEWYQDTYICDECGCEFMTENCQPSFCPYCGMKFEAVRIFYSHEHGNRIEIKYIGDKE